MAKQTEKEKIIDAGFGNKPWVGQSVQAEEVKNTVPAINIFNHTIKVALLDLENIKGQLVHDLFKKDAVKLVDKVHDSLASLVKE